MAQWISIEEAAAKYGFETEYIWRKLRHTA